MNKVVQVQGNGEITKRDRTNIFVSFQVEGFHYWKDAPEEVSFLRDRHRHMFHVEIEKEVSHADRDIEIILFKRKVQKFIQERWKGEENVVEFEGMSCEMIASVLKNEFKCYKVKVTEDGENGAVVY